MTSSDFNSPDGYEAKTFSFKETSDGPISVDVIYPQEASASPSTVILHFHGGFLLLGDRHSFLPPSHWLLRAAASRKWIFVTPEYRLLPESTAHESVDDAVEAYNWVRSSLPGLLGRPVGSVIVAGSSAGGYLALQTAVAAQEKPDALLSVYGMLDLAGPRYTTPGPNVFGLPAVEAEPVLSAFPVSKGKDEKRPRITAYDMPPLDSGDARLRLSFALHQEGLFADYATGVDGLGRRVAEQGVEAIPEEHRRLFPLSFGSLAGLPRTMLLHGVDDSAVPFECSKRAEERLRADGVDVAVEFPREGEHGFDLRIASDVEGQGGEGGEALESLRRVIRFLDGAVGKH